VARWHDSTALRHLLQSDLMVACLHLIRSAAIRRRRKTSFLLDPILLIHPLLIHCMLIMMLA